MRELRAVVAVLVLTCTAASLAAQEPDSLLAVLQAKETLPDEDRAVIRTWIGERVGTLAANDPSAAQQALLQMRTEFKGTPAFREAYAAACIDAIGSAYKKAPLIPATRLIAILGVLREVRSRNVLLEALEDDRPAVRAAAAIGLRNLRPQLAADADAHGRVLSALCEAGKKEASRETLQLIYGALNYAELETPPSLKPDVAAVLDLLEERVKQYAKDKVRAEGAEVAGLRVGGALRPAMDEAQRRRYAHIVARVLHRAVARYGTGERPLGKARDKTSGPDTLALRGCTELLIRDAEQQLAELLSLGKDETPGVTAHMQDAKLTEMVNELNGKWLPLLKEKVGLELAPLQPSKPDKGGGD